MAFCLWSIGGQGHDLLGMCWLGWVIYGVGSMKHLHTSSYLILDKSNEMAISLGGVLAVSYLSSSTDDAVTDGKAPPCDSPLF